jgi:putative transposase
VAFEFIEREKAHHTVSRMCRALGVSTSGYYAWRRRGLSLRIQEDERLSAQIIQLHQASRGTYGAPRIHADLAACGVRCGRKRVARLMRAAGIVGCHRRRRVRTTQREPRALPAPDRVQRRFAAAAPNQLWTADITYVPTWSGFLYLAVVLDVFSRRTQRVPLGWAMADHLRSELVVTALEMALWNRRPAKGVIHHSDRGSQYTSIAFGQRCQAEGIEPSMGAAGDCYDNAITETFFATLECELLRRHTFRTHAEARTALFDYIEGFYNTHRRHSALGYHAPAEYERAVELAVAA